MFGGDSVKDVISRSCGFPKSLPVSSALRFLVVFWLSLGLEFSGR